MRALACLLVYLMVVFAGGALLAPWLYHLTVWAGHAWAALGDLPRKPFHRFVDRAVLGLAIIGLWPFLLEFRMFGWRKLGFIDSHGGHGIERAAKQWALGFLLGFLSLAIVALVTVLCGVRAINLNHQTSETINTLLGAAATAIIVAVIEETMFRGALYGTLRGTLGRWQAILISSAIYAAAHFVQKAEAPGLVAWNTGLLMLPAMFRNLGDIAALIPAFFTLTIAGVILAIIYERTGTLYTSIGLHGGWIFWLKSYRFTTRPAAAKIPAFWGTDNLVDGWIALIVLSVVLLIALGIPRRPKTQAE